MQHTVIVRLSLEELMQGEESVYQTIYDEAVKDFKESEARMNQFTVTPQVVNSMTPRSLGKDGEVVIEATVTLHLSE